MMKLAFDRNSIGLLTLLLALAACSGGGGGGSAGTNDGSAGSDVTPSYTISGTVTLPDTAAVDSDTNDPAQVAWASNDTNATAQSLSTPVQLAGYLNMPGKGAVGKTYAAGDLQDIFKVSLVAGQVIELSFVSNTTDTDNDIDLLLFDVGSASAVPVGASSSGSSRECIAVTKDGSYYVMPWIVKGAAMYTLHISAANDGTSCANGMSSTALFVPGELVAQESVKSIAQSGSIGTQAMQATTNIPKLLSIPNSATQSRLMGRSALDSVDPRDADIQQAMGTLRYAKELMASGNYAYVEPNFRMEQFASYVPNDARYADQLWHYNQISLPDAMDKINSISVTNRAPIVAVIDAAFLISHPELVGHVADAYSFYGQPVPGVESPSGDAHGTFVSALAVATANNGLFGTGVAPMAKLIPIAFDMSSYSGAQAILYAAGLANSSGAVPARKADVINMSWGTGAACSALFADVIARARANNVVIVAAAGNTAPGKITPPEVASPASCPGAISVGATNIQKNRASYSGYGPLLTLTAPGGDANAYVYSSAFNASNNYAAVWAWGSGTSFSTPQVAGVVALMRYITPGISPDQIDTLIAAGRLTDDLGATGRDDQFGQGVINASKAVTEAYALASGGSLAGAVVPQPASINFGSGLSSTTLKLALTASGSETVSSIVASNPAITIKAAASVDAATNLGDYTISVDRKLLPAGFSYPVLTVKTSARTFTVPLSVTKLSASTSPTATFGAVWVRATNLATTTTYMQRVDVSGGHYTWSLSNVSGGAYVLSASTDLNNDGVFCNAGEVCGDYPGNRQTFQLGSNLGGLDFSMAPSLNTTTP